MGIFRQELRHCFEVVAKTGCSAAGPEVAFEVQFNEDVGGGFEEEGFEFADAGYLERERVYGHRIVGLLEGEVRRWRLRLRRLGGEPVEGEVGAGYGHEVG